MVIKGGYGVSSLNLNKKQNGWTVKTNHMMRSLPAIPLYSHETTCNFSEINLLDWEVDYE